VLGEYKGSQARELTMSLDEWIGLKPEARGLGAQGGGTGGDSGGEAHGDDEHQAPA
jgi:hypothetical protein